MKVLAALLCTYTLACTYAYDECNPDSKVCEFWLEVKERLTMVAPPFHGPPALVKASKGQLYKYDESPDNITTKIDPNSVITADGVQRMVIAVNGTIPGPPIVVYEGQQLIVHVQNNMLSDTLTMHWHGMYQRGTNYMDGVAYISQCPVMGGQSFTYKFKAEPSGTHWYHSHVGVQRTNGIYGALIVKEKSKRTEQMQIMTVGEWEHESTETSITKYTLGNYYDDEMVEIPKSEDGGNFTPIPWFSGLINGRGRYTDHKTGKSTGTPYHWFAVNKRDTIRFRVIHVAAQYPMRISVDGHQLIMAASDGHEQEKVTVESFIIQAGERFDFLIICDQPVKNYWVRAVSVEKPPHDHSVKAVLSYKGASKAEPTTDRNSCTADSKCKVFNCLWGLYPSKRNLDCVLIGDAKGLDESTPAWDDDSEEHFLNFNIPFTPTMGLINMVNGKVFNAPMVASNSQDNEIDPAKDCKKAGCGKGKICVCNHELVVPYGKTIQMVWLSAGDGAHGSHPIHLHGHSFHVLKTAFSPQDKDTALRIEATQLAHPDIDCGDDQYCNEPKWKNSAWNNGNIPGLNLKNPVRKDTIIVPNGGYVVVRITSDNPGKWFLHCHIEQHVIAGMAVVLASAMDKLEPPPKGFPLCGNFYNEPKIDFYRSNKEEDGIPVLTSVTCEPKSAHLNCPADRTLNIVSANYGRLDLTTCMRWTPYTIKNTDCKAANSLSIVRKKCQGRPSCSVKAWNFTFGEPCRGVPKYLLVKYQCVPGSCN